VGKKKEKPKKTACEQALKVAEDRSLDVGRKKTGKNVHVKEGGLRELGKRTKGGKRATASPGRAHWQK